LFRKFLVVKWQTHRLDEAHTLWYGVVVASANFLTLSVNTISSPVGQDDHEEILRGTFSLRVEPMMQSAALRAPMPNLRCNMTPLQNDTQEHQREAKHRTCRVSRGGKRSPDPELAHRVLSKSDLASHVVPRACDFTSNFDGGTTPGTPTCSRVRPSRNQCTTEALSRTPYR
jgi:hypothetical protein